MSTDRVRHLVAQVCELPPGSDSPMIAELCDIIFKGKGEKVVEVCSQYLRSPRSAHIIGGMELLHQCVLGSGPMFAELLAKTRFTELVYNVASETQDTAVRDCLIGRMVKWSMVYQLVGFHECVSELASNPALTETVSNQSDLNRQTSFRRHVDPTNSSVISSPLRTQVSGTTSSFNAAASPTTAAAAGTIFNQQQLNQARAGSPQQAPPQQRPSATNASDNSSNVAAMSASTSIRHERTQTLSTLETFIMEAQGDMASLEYSLEHPDMMDSGNVAECRKHLHKARNLLEQFPTMTDDNRALLTGLSDRLLEIINLYAAITGAPTEEGGDDEQRQRTAVMATSLRAQKPSSPVNHDAIAASAVTEAVRQEKLAIEKLMEEERKESQEMRAQLEKARRSKDELQAKYKEAKEKNKQLISLVEEYGSRVDELEAEKEAGGGVVAAAPAVVVAAEPKIVVQKPKVSKAVLDGINTEILDLRHGLRQLKEINLRDMMKQMTLQSIHIQSAITNKMLEADAKGRKADQAAMLKLQDLYKKEVKLRKQYYNTIQELKGNIRVYCRVRPMSEKELANGHTVIAEAISEDELRVVDERGTKTYEFDNVFGSDTTQEKVFEDTAPLIDSVVDGYNVCIFAYGQTGSGKTHTMGGGEGPQRGINRRALDRLFNIIKERDETEESSVTVSVLEIYCEQIRDLLVSKQVAAKTSYDIKTGGQYGNYVSNLTEVEVCSAADVEKVLSSASGNRSEGHTDMNAHSSRSHMVLYIVIKSCNKHTGATTYGKLSLVDLAGSERLDKSNAQGQGAKEAIAINKSLSALGDVIGGLSTGSKHIPFRNSQLTFLLQDSMSGQAKVLMFCCVSPASYNASETTSSLLFASRTRGVSLGPIKKNA